MERKIFAVKIVFVIAIVLFLYQFSAYVDKFVGYKPSDNAQVYKEWCEETFVNGDYIYEAYKDIAFNIKYTPEEGKTDFWQTPAETTELRKGDCEDAVFLFFSNLSSDQKNAEIVWGWVINKKSTKGKAHVWYQLSDKKGQQYIVEGFSKDWNGIIPMNMVEETETRRPILTMSHYEAAVLFTSVEGSGSSIIYGLIAGLHGSTDNPINPQDSEIDVCITDYARHHLNYGFTEYYDSKQLDKVLIDKEIRHVYKTLLHMFTRYYKQQKAEKNKK